MRDGLLTAPGVGSPRQPGSCCPELPEAHEESSASWSPGWHLQAPQQCGWEGDPQMSLSCWAWWMQVAEAPCPSPAPSVSRAWHSDGPHGGDCGLPATGLWSGHAVPCPLPTRRGEGPRAYLHLLLGMQLLPKGPHARCEPQEARNALLEELLVVGLHRPLQTSLLSPPFQQKAQPRGPHLQGEEVRPSSPCLGSPRGCAHNPPCPPPRHRLPLGEVGAVGCGAPITFACSEKDQNHRARAVPCCSRLLFTSYQPEKEDDRDITFREAALTTRPWSHSDPCTRALPPSTRKGSALPGPEVVDQRMIFWKEQRQRALGGREQVGDRLGTARITIQRARGTCACGRDTLLSMM